ncbi:MAG: DUF2971 domain-containing protein [bacterium]|nr:DUF2971 domain-containing protein [bacterium]
MDQEAISVPDFLYKFRRWRAKDGEAHDNDQLILKHQAVWFASPADFNDPFDCKIPFRCDLMSRNEQYKMVYDISRRKFPHWDAERLRSETERELQSNPLFSETVEVAGCTWEGYYDLIAERYGVLSFAGNCTDILMWSHYADSHRGYCVKLAGKALNGHMRSRLSTDKEAIRLFRVRYERDLPTIVPSNNGKERLERHLSLLYHKSRAWEYEQEYRFIFAGKTRLSRGVDPDVIKRVIFGCRMPPDHRMEIADVVHAELPNTELWEAVRSNDRFELDFRPWNPEDK